MHNAIKTKLSSQNARCVFLLKLNQNALLSASNLSIVFSKSMLMLFAKFTQVSVL